VTIIDASNVSRGLFTCHHIALQLIALTPDEYKQTASCNHDRTNPGCQHRYYYPPNLLVKTYTTQKKKPQTRIGTTISR